MTGPTTRSRPASTSDDLLDRLDAGDSAALGELLEHATGAKVAYVKVTLPRHAAPAAGD
ncbi:MAG: hypothetical protein ABR540_00935 [Acidimicrobiales bacterium]